MQENDDKDPSLAFRLRMQSQALCHDVGQSIESYIVMRFRKAGTWTGDITHPISEAVLSALTQPDKSAKLTLPSGPMTAIIDNEGRGIIEICEQLLSHDARLRRAAFDYFLNSEMSKEDWISPYVIDLLKKNEDALMSEIEANWIDAGLTLREAIQYDFRVNCAGVRQSLVLRHIETYEEYRRKCMWPSAHCFYHDRPPFWNPLKDGTQLSDKFRAWSSYESLQVALNEYLAFCGYLPLTGKYSLGSFIAEWELRHPGNDIWKIVWDWVSSSKDILAHYHATSAFLEHPEWIAHDDIELLVKTLTRIINQTDDETETSSENIWHLMSILLQHYQFHIEAAVPGLDSEAAASTACWLADRVAGIFSSDDAGVKKIIELWQSEVLPISHRRWSMARSRMPASPLRTANLKHPSIWSDSLLALTAIHFKNLPDFEGRDGFKKSIVSKLNTSIIRGSVRTNQSSDISYAFELPVNPSHLDISNDSKGDAEVEVLRSVLAIRNAIDSGGFEELLSTLSELPEGAAIIACASLHIWRIDQDNVSITLKKLLNDREWGEKVFQQLPVRALDDLIAFLIDWQMLQDEQWLVRVPQILATECEKAKDSERRELLFGGTIESSLAVDIASPVKRILMGQHRTELIGAYSNWQITARKIAINSEPWLASRLRGLLAT